MQKPYHRTIGVLALVTIIVALGLMLYSNQSEAGGKINQAGRYSVIATEGTNLIVTDNATNTLYFYVVDQDQPAGSDLKLRGTVDLSQVGQMVIRPKTTKKVK